MTGLIVRFCAITLLVVVAAHFPSATAADPWWSSASPILTVDTVPAAQPPGIITVTGRGFTPGGSVRLIIVDHLGTELDEIRWLTARLTSEDWHRGDGAGGPPALVGGEFREAFSGFCGRAALMRAYDQATDAWSNWLEVRVVCELPAPFEAADPSL